MGNSDFDSLVGDLLSLDCLRKLENVIEWKSCLVSRVLRKVNKNFGRKYFERVKKLTNYLVHSKRVGWLGYNWASDDKKRDYARAGVSHDIGKALGGRDRYLIIEEHSRVGADFLREFGENETVVNAVRRHMFPMNRHIPRTRVDWIIWLADKYDSLKRDYYTLKCLFC